MIPHDRWQPARRRPLALQAGDADAEGGEFGGTGGEGALSFGFFALRGGQLRGERGFFLTGLAGGSLGGGEITRHGIHPALHGSKLGGGVMGEGGESGGERGIFGGELCRFSSGLSRDGAGGVRYRDGRQGGLERALFFIQLIDAALGADEGGLGFGKVPAMFGVCVLKCLVFGGEFSGCGPGGVQFTLECCQAVRGSLSGAALLALQAGEAGAEGGEFGGTGGEGALRLGFFALRGGQLRGERGFFLTGLAGGSLRGGEIARGGGQALLKRDNFRGGALCPGGVGAGGGELRFKRIGLFAQIGVGGDGAGEFAVPGFKGGRSGLGGGNLSGEGAVLGGQVCEAGVGRGDFAPGLFGGTAGCSQFLGEAGGLVTGCGAGVELGFEGGLAGGEFLDAVVGAGERLLDSGEGNSGVSALAGGRGKFGADGDELRLERLGLFAQIGVGRCGVGEFAVPGFKGGGGGLRLLQLLAERGEFGGSQNQAASKMG